MGNENQPFRVIIAGGSVVGIVLANALEKAGIDYVVLEKGEIAPHLGASVSVLCHTAKVFEQLGVWETMLKNTLPLMHRQHFDEAGRLLEDTAVLEIIAKRTGRPFLFMERRYFIQTLYDNLPAESRRRIKSHTGLASFREDEQGVTVVTDQGEEIRGSMLVGADGVHSTVRTLLSSYVKVSDPSRSEGFEQGFTATYRTIFGTSRDARADDPSSPFLPPGTVHNVYHRGFSGAAASGVEGLVFWFLFVKQDKPSTTPRTPRYSEADAQRTMDEFGRHALGPGYTFSDLWEARVRAVMVPLEEGVLGGSWNSGGRVLLMGDSVVKATINPGIGANTHVEGVCHLVNGLYDLVNSSEHHQPATEELQELFEGFEKKQKPRSQIVVNFSGYITRYEAMDTWYWRLALLLSPWIPDRLKANGFLGFISDAPILEFLPNPDSS